MGTAHSRILFCGPHAALPQSLKRKAWATLNQEVYTDLAQHVEQATLIRSCLASPSPSASSSEEDQNEGHHRHKPGHARPGKAGSRRPLASSGILSKDEKAAGKERVLTAFRSWDCNRDGFISKDELR